MTRDWLAPADPPSNPARDAAVLVRGVCQLVCLWVAEDNTVARWTK